MYLVLASAALLMAGPPAAPTEDGAASQLATITVTGRSRGYIALDSVTATRTDTLLINVPQTITASGLEIDGRFEVSETLSIRAAVSVTDARIDGGLLAPQLTGLRPAQAPSWSATGGVDWRATDRLTLAADLRWESRRFEDDLNSRVLEAAATVDLRAEWALSSTTRIWLVADNLFDAEVEVSETATGIAGFGPPRTFSLGVRHSL